MSETHTPLKIEAPADSKADAGISGDETVNEVLERHPELGPALMAFGLCTCCSGGLTLRQNAEAHGVPLSDVLRSLRDELAKGA